MVFPFPKIVSLLQCSAWPSLSMQALLDAIATFSLPVEAQRIFHGRGGLHPGCEHWTLDAFPPVLVLTRFLPATEDTEQELEVIGAALQARWQQLAPGAPLNWVFQCRSSALRQQGRSENRLMAGSVPEPHTVLEQGALFRVQVEHGQNHGLFLDMAEGRRWVHHHTAAHRDQRFGFTVLNLFAYTCAFSVVALRAGAKHVVNVDMSRSAMATGQHNHRLNGLDGGASFLVHDIFSTWGKINRSGPYSLVVIDPPTYQKGSFVATKDYARLVRRLPELVAPGGHALLCLNAPELGVAFLQDQLRELAPALEFVERVANGAAFAEVSPERALKVLVYRMPPLPGLDSTPGKAENAAH